MKWINFQVQVPVFARKWHNSHAGGSGASTNASCVQCTLYMCVYLSVLVHSSQDRGCLGSVAGRYHLLWLPLGGAPLGSWSTNGAPASFRGGIINQSYLLWWVSWLFQMLQIIWEKCKIKSSRFPCCVLSYFSLVFVMELTNPSHKSQLSRAIN